MLAACPLTFETYLAHAPWVGGVCFVLLGSMVDARVAVFAWPLSTQQGCFLTQHDGFDLLAIKDWADRPVQLGAAIHDHCLCTHG